MRIFLLPISTSRSLIYGQGSHDARFRTKLAQTWLAWENSDDGWKKAAARVRNKTMEKIPYQETALRSIEAASTKTKEAADSVEILFPGRFIEKGRVLGVLRRLALERQSLHLNRFYLSLVLMPFTAPFALLPM
jgi:hypothetical protein